MKIITTVPERFGKYTFESETRFVPAVEGREISLLAVLILKNVSREMVCKDNSESYFDHNDWHVVPKVFFVNRFWISRPAAVYFSLDIKNVLHDQGT